MSSKSAWPRMTSLGRGATAEVSVDTSSLVCGVDLSGSLSSREFRTTTRGYRATYVPLRRSLAVSGALLAVDLVVSLSSREEERR
jgi:hypothetical protein